MQTTAHDYRLVTLDVAIAPYRGVSLRTARGWIRDGKLPAAKAGRGYLVDPADVARLLTPQLRAAGTRPKRESENARAERQLAEAGVGRVR
jgi:excisionase family DNA binding protein